MQPNKLPADTEESPVITTEGAVQLLHAELRAMLTASKGANQDIDEHQAKIMRKSWEALRLNAESAAVDVAELEQDFEKLRVQIQHQVDARNKRYLELAQLVEKLQTEVKHGNLKNAQQLEQKITAELDTISGLSSQRRQKINGKIERLQPQIKKLASWRHWGTAQARQKIIDEIKNLHHNEKSLNKVAQRIKQARDEWKQWDNSGEGGNHKLYKQFDAACSKAYEPCKQMFAAQGKQRVAGSRDQKQLIALLESEYQKIDWRNPDWKKIAQMLREQSTRWKQLGAAEFRHRKPLQKSYDAIIDKFESPLCRERKRNLQLRKNIVESVQKLSLIEDPRKAIGELQILQKQWIVTVSSGKRRQEQAIWKKFTAGGDAVYERVRQAKQSLGQQLEQNLSAKQAICLEVEIATKQQATDTKQLAEDLKKWNVAWSKVGNVPKPKSKQIDTRFNDATAAIKKQLEKIEQQNQAKTTQKLFAMAAFCTTLETDLYQQNKFDVDSVNANWNGLERVGDEIQALMQTRFDNAIAGVGDDAKRQKLIAATAKNFEKINGCLLRLEINAGIDSPPAYAKQRMALQICRLSAAMGKAEQEMLDSDQLVAAIHTTGIVSPQQQQQINQRFNTCYRALLK